MNIDAFKGFEPCFLEGLLILLIHFPVLLPFLLLLS